MRRQRLIQRAAVALVTGLGWCAGPAAALSTPNLAAELGAEPFVYETLRGAYRFEADGTAVSTRELRVRVQSEAGVQRLGQLLLAYVEGRDRLEVKRLQVERPDGSVIEAAPDQVRDLPAPVTAAYPVYSDLRVLHVTLPALRAGDTVTFHLVAHLEQPDTPGRFSLQHSFALDAPALSETLEVDVPAEVPVQVRTARGEQPTVTERGGRRVYRWLRSWQPDAAAAAATPTEPGFDVVLSSFRDWSDVGRWYRELAADRSRPTSEVRRKAEELTAGIDEPRAKVEALYRFVTRELRYLALAFGMSRYRPHAAGEVLASGYGDCKDKHTLFAALLAAVGIEGSPVLVNSQHEVETEVPSPGQFDHMITAVRIGDELLFLDSTSQVSPFGYLAPSVRGTMGLMIRAEGPVELTRIPEELPFPIVVTFIANGAVEASGRLTAKVEQQLRGDEEIFLRTAFLGLPREQWPGVLRQLLSSWGVRGEVADLEVENPTDAGEPLTLAYMLNAADYLDWFGAEQEVEPLVPLPDLPAGKAGEALDLGGPGTIGGSFVLTLPEHLQARAPVAVEIGRDFATYRSAYRVEDGRLTAERELSLRARTIAPEQLREYGAFRASFRADRDQEFAVAPATGAKLALEAIGDLPGILAAAERASDGEAWEEAVRLYERAVELEPDHPTAWHELGRVRVLAGRTQEGVDALRRQVEVDGYHEQVHSNLGWALEKLGDVGGAETAYRRQLELYPLNLYSNAALGRLLAQLERCAEAVAYLEKAVALQSDDESSRGRLGACQLALGQTDEALTTLAPLAEVSDARSALEAGAALAADHPAAAIPVLRRAAELDAEDAETWLALAGALMATRSLDEGIEAARRALQVDPDLADAHALVGAALSAQGRHREAADSFRTYTERVPDDPLGWESLADELAIEGRRPEAADAYRRLVAVAPDNAIASAKLGWILFHSDDWAGARAALERAIEALPDDPLTNQLLGTLDARQERWAEALRHLDKARAAWKDGPFPDQDLLEYVRTRAAAGG